MTRKKEEFIPMVPGKASIYVCGVTPYNHPHIGNARPFVTWDVIHRFLEHEQSVKAAVDGKSGEFPFDDPGKPDESPDVGKANRAERLIRLKDFKSLVFKGFFLLREI